MPAVSFEIGILISFFPEIDYHFWKNRLLFSYQISAVITDYRRMPLLTYLSLLPPPTVKASMFSLIGTEEWTQLCNR